MSAKKKDKVPPQKPSKKFGAAVRAARMAKGLSQTALAALLEVSQPCVCMVESGRSAPGPKLIAKLAKVLRVSA